MARDERTRYLRRRGNVWHVRLAIPRDLQPFCLTRNGEQETHKSESLRTGDLDRAHRAKWAYINRWQAEFDRKRREAKGSQPQDLADAMREAGAGLEDDDAELHAIAAIEHAGRMVEAGASEEDARAWVARATEVHRPTLRQIFSTWTEDKDRTPATLAAYQHAFDEFMRQMQLPDAMPETITRKHAQQYVDWLNKHATTPKGAPLAFKTKRTRVIALSSFWRYLSRREHVTQGVNLWSDLEVSGKKLQRREPRPHTDAEVMLLLNGPEKRDGVRYPKRTLLELYALGFYTGARLNELCSLHVGDVEPIRRSKGYIVHIRESKTPAGIRSLPIVHPIPAAVIKRRIGKRTDPKAQLFEEFIPGKFDKLSWYPGKALGQYRDRVGLPTEVDFHSTRRNFAVLVDAKVSNGAWLSRYLGHTIPGVTQKDYVKAGSPEALRAVAELVTYPKRIEQALGRELGIK